LSQIFLFKSLPNFYHLLTDLYFTVAMEITNHKNLNSGVLTIRVSGDVDLYSASILYKTYCTIADRGESLVHFDFSAVNYLDSSGVGAIIRILQVAKSKGLRLSFSGIQGTPRKVLAMSNILPLLKEVE